MKLHGSKVEYEEERNQDLLRAFRELMLEAKQISWPEIYGKLVNMPSKRFWVSEERATIVISAMLKGVNILDGMRPSKREMFTEIYNRVVKMLKERPQLPLPIVVFNVIRQEAPKFYLTPKTAKYYIFYAKKKCYEEKKHKLRHLFY